MKPYKINLIKFKEVIAKSGLKQKDLAAKLNINESLVSQHINGKFRPSVSNLMAYSLVLNIPISELIGN